MKRPDWLLMLSIFLAGVCAPASPQTPTPRPIQSADLHRTGWIDMMDLFVLSAGWEEATGPWSGDLDASGRCGPKDLLMLLGNWHTTPIEMVTIPPGSFLMGPTGSERDQGFSHPSCWFEGPRREVTFRYSYQMSRYEVTNTQYAEMLDWVKRRSVLQYPDGGIYDDGNVRHSGQMLLAASHWDCDITFDGVRFAARMRYGNRTDNHPVKMVTWYGAVAYCNWASERDSLPVCYDLSDWSLTNPHGGGYRLPTESEWENACRGSSSNPNRYAPFSFGDDLSVGLEDCDYSSLFDQHMVWCGNADMWTSEVEGRLPNDYGLYGMHGNVCEWCQDSWTCGYGDTPGDGSPSDESSMFRVIRGGHRGTNADGCRSAARHSVYRTKAFSHIGFRLARTLGGSAPPTAMPTATLLRATPTPTPSYESITIDIPNLPEGARPMRLIRIPAGSFLMGSPEDERGHNLDAENEGPIHTVTITNDFYVGETEVTQAQWEAVTGKSIADQRDLAHPLYDLWGVGHDYPAYYIAWLDITRKDGFLDKLDAQTDMSGFRLPTEAEWEYACRGGTQTRFFFGDSLGCDDQGEDCLAGLLPGSRSDYMWYSCRGDPHWGPKISALLLPNQLGLYDMSGNLGEWCEDWYQADFYSQPEATLDNPLCANSESGKHVFRGGIWLAGAARCRSAYRSGGWPTDRSEISGFRVVLPTSAKSF